MPLLLIPAQWWTQTDRSVFENNIQINAYQPPSVKAFTKEGQSMATLNWNLFRKASQTKQSGENLMILASICFGVKPWLSILAH